MASKYTKAPLEKKTFPHCWWECKLVQPLWRRVGKGSSLKKLKNIESPYDPAMHEPQYS